MTLWWIERVRNGKREIVVPASKDRVLCDTWMAAVHELQPSDGYVLCFSNTGGDRQEVRRYTPPAKASEPDSTSEALDGEWQPGPWRTNDGRECVILQVQEDGVLHWAVATPNGTWNVYCDLPCRAIHHPAPPVRHVVDRCVVDKDGCVQRSLDGHGVLVRWAIRGGKIVEAEVLEGEQ